MNHHWVNQDPNYVNQPITQGLYMHRQNDNHKLKRRAYINPQIVNYDYIKMSLAKNSMRPSNKIHVNPNFKGFGNLQSNSLQLSNPLINPVMNVNHGAPQEPGTSRCESFPLTGGGSDLSEKTTRIVNRFKKINNASVKSGSKSKFTWSRNSDNCVEKVKASSSVPASSDKSKGFFTGRNIYKYTGPRKISKVTNTKTKNSVPEKSCIPIHVSRTKLINKTKTKLINAIPQKNKLIKTPIKRHINLSQFTYNKNKKSPATKVAISVRNKYKYSNPVLASYSKYKIDKRKKVSEASQKRKTLVHDITKLFPSNFHNRVTRFRRVHPHYAAMPYKNIHHWRKDSPKAPQPEKRISRFPNRRVVKIGGILYKSTANKLILASKKTQPTSLGKSSPTKVRKYHVVYVRGEKFILDKNGKTLRRQSPNFGSGQTSLSTPQRIDIGGVTYMKKSQNVLIRTNVHQARYLVNKAKSKSIAMLTSLYKRSSLPCMIYHKFGRCIRHTKGLCMYTHDPKNIAICKKFLKGKCDSNNCLLSHEVIQEKVATCHFFLNGFCARENCPFLHVKLSKNASICNNFLQGFCNLGKDCSKRHFYQCPDFDKYGTCKLGTKCHYPHKAPEKSSGNQSGESPSKDQDKVQYFVKPSHGRIKQKREKTKRTLVETKQSPSKKSQKKRAKSKSLPVDQANDTVECVPKRIKLDDLPCYIPLNP